MLFDYCQALRRDIPAAAYFMRFKIQKLKPCVMNNADVLCNVLAIITKNACTD